MKSIIKDIIDLTTEEKKELWGNALFVFDSNVLLSLYKRSDKYNSELFKVLSKNSERIWIPYQVAFELSSNRHQLIYQYNHRGDKVRDITQKFISEMLSATSLEEDDSEIVLVKKELSKFLESFNRRVKKIDYSSDRVLDKLLNMF